MLSEQLTPSSANFVPRPQYSIEDDSSTISPEEVHSSTTSIQNNSNSTTISCNTKATATLSSSTAATTTLSIPGILNVSDGKTYGNGSGCGHLSLQYGLSTNSPATNSAASDANGRSAALERAYVHDVYENCDEPSGPIRPRVAQFLAGLEPGSIVCDVGCGNGRYLTSCNPLICTIGVDRCYRLAKIAREKGGEVALCDNLELPFRDESFDAVLSLAVVHHFATTERRVGAIRELARILRIGGRVVITVWALEQRHRRFESQDVLIPWQPPKNRNFNYSDDEDDDDYLPPYHAYTEDSTNSSRSAGDGDSSSLSSSSPGESCYSFVRRAIQKLAGGRKHSWFLDSWTSKDTKNDSSLDYEDAKDLPIELRRLEDFEEFPDPPLSAGLKSRSLGSILNPPPRQIVRSRSSVPSLGAQMPEQKSTSPSAATIASEEGSGIQQSPQKTYIMAAASSATATTTIFGVGNSTMSQSSMSTTILQQNDSTSSIPISTANSSQIASHISGRRPKLVKQKQSLCDDEQQLPDNSFHNNCNSTNNNSCCNTNNITNTNVNSEQQKLFLRKQSSLNEELMAESRLREKERVRKRIQKQISLNEAFLCRSVFTKRLQIIREGFTTKLKTSTGSLERATKNGFVKIMQNFKTSQFANTTTQNKSTPTGTTTSTLSSILSTTQKDHIHDSTQQQQHHHSNTVNNQSKSSTICTGSSSTTNSCNNTNCNNSCSSNVINNGNEDQKPRRHSRESGSDSSKDSSLQSDTSIESEDSFASVIYIPRPEQSNQQQNSINVNCNNNNSSLSSNGHSINSSINCNINNSHKIPSVPTSPLILPCPPTPAHSPAASTTANTISTASGMSIFSPPKKLSNSNVLQGNSSKTLSDRFTFDDEDILQHHHQQNIKYSPAETINYKGSNSSNNIIGTNNNSEHRNQQILQQKLPKITRQTIKDLPVIPKFRKQQSLQSHMYKTNFPIVRRASAAPAMPKLMSLELFNPETDDLDSDSSEPSSPDSIDSVISALKPSVDEETLAQQQKNQQQQAISDETKIQNRCSLDTCVTNKIENQQTVDNTNLTKNHQRSTNQNQIDLSDMTKREQQSNMTFIDNLTIVECETSDIITDKCLALSKSHDVKNSSHKNLFCNSNTQQNFVDFAEQLSAQLLKELEEKDKLDKNVVDCSSVGEIDSSDFTDTIDNPFVNNRSGEIRDLCTLREELRERRLMLANLTSPKSPTPTSSSTSSLSSQTRSFTIHEEEDEGNETYLSTYDSRSFKAKYLRNFTNSSGYHHYNFIPDTACLIQDDGESSGRGEDLDDIENGVILEEDEDQLDGDGEYDVGGENNDCDKRSSNTTCLDDSSSPPTQLQMETRQSTESWGHSNSETSLDSPSQGGGATTHHRYYHVFREGELDALINHHVASLHIVSSYYERASWCVVAEKVQVWTI